MERRVVITGMGCITPLGTRPEQLWERLQNGESGVGYTQAFDASEFPTKFSSKHTYSQKTNFGLEDLRQIEY